MRGIILILLLFLVTMPAYSFVDSLINGISNSINASAEEAHRRFVELKWVENIRILNQNYTASKDFYERMEKITQHRGGVGGYIEERLGRNLERIGDESVWKLKAHMESDPDDTAYVRKWIAETDKSIEKRFDYSKQIRELGKKKTEETNKLKEEVAKPSLSSQEYDSAMLKAAMLQIEMLTLVNKNLELLLELERSRDEDAWSAAKERQAKDDKAAKTHAAAYDYLKKQKVGPKKNPWEVFREVPK